MAGGERHTVLVDARIDAPASAVWARVGDFTTWHSWIPRIVATAMDAGHEAGQIGAVRTLTLSDGSTVRERLALKDDQQRRIGYDFPQGSPFPVAGYLAQVQVEPDGDASIVHWSSEFEASHEVSAKVSATFTTIYTTFLGDLTSSLTNAD